MTMLRDGWKKSLATLRIEYMRERRKAKIQSYMSGATAWPQRRRMKEKEKRIQTLFDRFNTGGSAYLSAIKHLHLTVTFVIHRRGGMTPSAYLSAIKHLTGLIHFVILGEINSCSLIWSWSFEKLILWQLIYWELTSCKVDLVRIDLVGVDLAKVDLVWGNPNN